MYYYEINTILSEHISEDQAGISAMDEHEAEKKLEAYILRHYPRTKGVVRYWLEMVDTDGEVRREWELEIFI